MLKMDSKINAASKCIILVANIIYFMADKKFSDSDESLRLLILL